MSVLPPDTFSLAHTGSKQDYRSRRRAGHSSAGRAPDARGPSLCVVMQLTRPYDAGFVPTRMAISVSASGAAIVTVNDRLSSSAL